MDEYLDFWGNDIDVGPMAECRINNRADARENLCKANELVRFAELPPSFGKFIKF